MNELTPLTRPLQSQITIDAIAKECPSDGFNYPSFRQLNKHARIYLSKPLQLEPGVSYQLFDIANSTGWFVAVKHSSSGSDLVISTLEDLRSAFPSATENPDNLFNPKRIISIPSKANIVKFACGDTRLLVGQDNGSILLYDTAQIFTEGGFDVHPLTSTHIQTTYLRQIVPNPGNEPGLSDLMAVVANGKVQLVNIQLEPQGGWVATDDATQPVAVDWSPKGKHIAIGIQTGDILTFSLTNKSAPHKHIPPTANAPLASLRWLGPGHTFRTTYAESPPVQHIIVLDTKSSTAIYFSPEHPYRAGDRVNQRAYTISLPKWDTDAASNDDSKSLTVVGDISSVDLEILGNAGNSWYRQSQENPLTLPLDNSMDDTILLSLEVDFTDITTAVPIMYAYLNDGSLQGWHLEYSKPYAGMITPSLASSTAVSSTPSQESSKDAEMSGQQTSTLSAFGQQSSTTTSAFGQSSFGTQSSSPFGGQQTSAFGQTGFGQKSAQATSAFGQSSFGQPSAFGAASAFGQSNQPSTSAFGDVKPGTGFGAFSSGSNSPFGGGASGAFGSRPAGGAFGSNPAGSAFGGLASGATNVFGQSSFSVNNASNSSEPGNASSSHSPTMIREASMSDSTPGFGGMSLGSAHPSDPNAVNSMFGSFSTTSSSTNTSNTTNQTSSAFGSGSIVKPASGFGAFGNLKTSSAFDAKPAATTTSAFGSTPQPTSNTGSGAGQSGFAANSAFGKPAFGQSTFGKPSLPTPMPSSTSGGGFGAFANAPTSFSAAAQHSSTTTPSSGAFGAYANAPPATFGSVGGTLSSAESKPPGGFGAFASGTPSAFGSTTSTTETKPAFTLGGGFGAFASTASSPFGSSPAASSTANDMSKTSAFGNTSAKPSPFGEVKNVFGGQSFGVTGSPLFGTPTKIDAAASPAGSPKHSESFSPSSSPEPTKSPFGNQGAAVPTTSTAANAFSNLQTTPSAFKPATGFGAFGNLETKSSPFFKKPDEAPSQLVSVFGLGGSPKTPTAGAAAPTFGSPSTLGGPKSAFAPVTPASTTPTKSPSSGGFGAFSGSSSGFSAFAGPKSAFSDLLKTGGEETKDPVKPALSDKGQKPQERISVFGTPVTPPKKETPPVASAFAPIAKNNDKESKEKAPLSKESTFESISGTSASSSFVDVNADDSRGEEHDSDEDAAHSGDDDAHSFLSENFSDSYEEDEVDEEDGLEDGEVYDGERSPSPGSTAAPLPSSRSPSATPQPETPSIEVSASPDDEKPSRSPTLSSSRATSTTPPATPAAESKPIFGVPATPGASPSPSPFGLGLGRPSTRPARSSPLANAVSNDEEEDEKPVVSPKVPVEILPLKSEDDKKDDASAKRPKTPPLLSTLGGIAAPVPVPPGSAAATPPILEKTSAFGQPSASSPSFKSSSPAALPFGFGAQPTATTSAPSLFGKASETQPKPDLAHPVGMPPRASPPSSAPKPGFSIPAFPAPSQPAPSATSSLFGIKPPILASIRGAGVFGAPDSSPAQAPPSLFGAPSTSPSPFGKPAASPSSFGGFSTFPSPLGATPASPSPFGAPFGLAEMQPSLKPTPSLFGTASGLTQQPAAPPFSLGAKPPGAKVSPVAVPPATIPAPPTPAPEAILEEGMQKECVNLVNLIARDLMELRQLSQVANNKLAEMSISAGGSRLKADLGVAQKWGFSDLQQFGQILQQYQADLDLLASQRDISQKALRDAQSNLVKAGARREEIARFTKAKNDKEFAKMLRARTLGPEHSETQVQLRKNIRMIRDRVQKLETRLQENKKKLAQSTSFKPSFRAPSLDTINRTYRNIELTIEQQTDDVTRLASRISKLNVDDTPATPSPRPRDARLPEVNRRRAYNVTPTVAVTTAAALNAERSAHRLKKALLLVRKEPLLNTKAASAPRAPVAFDTPRKPGSSAAGGGFAFQAPLTEPLFSRAPVTPADAIPDWDIPEDNFNPMAAAQSSGRRGVTGQRKHPSVPLKRSTGAVPVTPPPAGFEWGPLPNFSSPSASTAPKAFVPFFSSPSPGGK